MRKIYFASALILVFLGALAIDWNASQSGSRQEGAASMIRSRNDDILELQVGYPNGYSPPKSALHTPQKKETPKPLIKEKTGEKTVEQYKTQVLSHYIEYKMRPGDTISGICQRYLKKDRRKRELEIISKNNISDPKLIRAGQTILIPRD